jgi:hypothetical protein
MGMVMFGVTFDEMFDVLVSFWSCNRILFKLILAFFDILKKTLILLGSEFPCNFHDALSRE